jgi:hypothetical protein
MRNVISIVFIAMILVSTVGHFPLFKMEQMEVQAKMRKKIKSGIPHHKLCTINFSSNETIRWIKKGKEFILRNQLYDVVRKDPQQPFTFYCLNDTEESKLFAKLQYEVNKETKDQNHPLNIFAKLILELTYTIEDLDFNPHSPTVDLDKKINFNFINNYSSIYLPLDSLPPSAGFHF